MLAIEAVVFDFEGTLVDVDDQAEKARRAVAKRIAEIAGELDVGAVLEKFREIDVFMDRCGVQDRGKRIKLLSSLLGLQLSADVLQELVELYWSELSSVKLYPDALPCLESLRKLGVKLGLLANGDGIAGLKKRRIFSSGLADFFDAIIVAGEDVPHFKPHPQPYIEIMDALRVRACATLYVSDNFESDLVGAKRAGMAVALIDRRGLYSDIDVTLHLKSLSELANYITPISNSLTLL